MSNYYVATVSFGSTGSKTISNGTFQPIGCRITIGSKFNTVDTVLHQGVGMVDDTSFASCTSIYGDSTGYQTKTTNGANGKCLSQWDRVSGVLTEVMSATFTAYTTTGITINMTATTSNYQLQIEMWD